MIPRPGDYIVVRTTGFVPALIRMVTRSRFNHAAIVAEDDQVIEAEPGGVRIRPLAEYDGCLMLSNTAEPTLAEERAKIVEFARYLIGEKYNFEMDLADGLDRLGIRWLLLSRFAEARKSIMCSQLVAVCGQHAGLPSWLCGKPSAGAVVPGDLATRIEKRQWA